MKCEKCGHDNFRDNKFCSDCGNPLFKGKITYSDDVTSENISGQRSYVPVLTKESEEHCEIPDSRDCDDNKGDTQVLHDADRFNDSYRREIVQPVVKVKKRHEKKKTNTLKILLVIFLIVVICCASVLALFLFTDIFGKNCSLCDAEFDNEGDYCLSCVENYTCMDCKTVEKTVKNGYCEKCIENHVCAACGNIGNDVIKGFCNKCIGSYTCLNCKTVDFDVEEGYCVECTKLHICIKCKEFNETLNEGYCDECKGLLTCKDCGLFDENMEDNYCEACKPDHLCDVCGKVADKIRNGYCPDCAQRNYVAGKCFECRKTLNKTISYMDKDDFYYCEECDTGFYCDRCGAPVASAGAKCKYH